MTLADRLRAAVDGVPEEGSVVFPVAAVRRWLETEEEGGPTRTAEPEPVADWRAALWSAPAETRLGVHEAADALGRPVSFIYRHTSARAENRLPHRKLDGELVFLAGELRGWIRDREELVVGGALEAMP